jgi:hypothetical protein
MISNDFYILLNLFGDPCPLCKHDLLEKTPSCLFHNLLYMNVIFIFIIYLLPSYLNIFSVNYINCKNVVIFYLSKTVKGKYIIFSNIQEYLFLT